MKLKLPELGGIDEKKLHFGSFLALKFNVLTASSILSKILQYLFSQLPSINTIKIIFLFSTQT